MAEERPPPRTVVIQLPGVSDIIAAPAFEAETTKRERISRMALAAAASPVPEPLRWLPQVVNYIDDIQDFLFVVTTSAVWTTSFLLRRFPTRFLPYLGWALLANDALNIATATFSAPLIPRLDKVNFLRFTKNSVAGKGARVRAAEAFLLPGRAKMIPFVLQAGQVLYSFTGWGLKLGTLMGTVSDTMWAAIAAVQGADIVIRPPPRSDILGYAASIISRSVYWDALLHVASSAELQYVFNALQIAAGVLGAPRIQMDIGDRLRELEDRQFPLWDFVSSFTADEFRRLGYPSVRDQRPPTLTIIDRPTWSDAVRTSIAAAPLTDIELAIRFRPTTFDWPFGLQATELAQWSWDVFGGGHDFVVPSTSPMERMLGIALETGTIPPFLYHPRDERVLSELLKWGIRIADIADCPLRVDRPFDEPRYYKLPPAYPPPTDDPNGQLAHWCAVGLALWCGRSILLPTYELRPVTPTTPTCNSAITGWFVNSRKWALQSMSMASWLVWGVSYTRFALPADQPAPASEPKPSMCRASGFALPGLSGYFPELPGLMEILAAWPTDPEVMLRTGTEGKPFDPLLGRDWLDAYMRAHDPRRDGRDAYPALDVVPLPESFVTPVPPF